MRAKDLPNIFQQLDQQCFGMSFDEFCKHVRPDYAYHCQERAAKEKGCFSWLWWKARHPRRPGNLFLDLM